MHLLPTLITITLILHSTVGRCKRPKPNPVMSALQSMLSPANAERTMQMLKMATQQLGNTDCNPFQPPIPVKYPPIPLPEPCNTPINLQISMPNLMASPLPSQIPLQTSPPVQTINPIQIQMQNPISYQIPNLTPVPSAIQLPVQLPSSIPLPYQVPQYPTTLASEIIFESPVQLQYQVPQLPSSLATEIILERPCEREIDYLVYPSVDISTYAYPSVTMPEVIAPVPLTPAEDIYSCPLPSPAALFVPVAPPICGCAQESCAGCRSQYLRKIPIPPPTL